MKHSFTSNSGNTLEVRESGRSVKLFLLINGTFKRIDDQPLKPTIVTALLQEIIKLKTELDSTRYSLTNAHQNSPSDQKMAGYPFDCPCGDYTRPGHPIGTYCLQGAEIKSKSHKSSISA